VRHFVASFRGEPIYVFEVDTDEAALAQMDERHGPDWKKRGWAVDRCSRPESVEKLTEKTS